MLPQVVQDALNDQIQREFYAAYLYLSMSAYFESLNLPGFARWMRVQSQEEVEHAMRIFDFVNERNGRVVLKAIPQPPTEFESPLAAMQAAYEHEQRVTGYINELYELAVREKDYPTQVMLHWFIEEQVEEEQITGQIVERLKVMGDDPVTLLLMDNLMGQRKEED